VFSTVRSCVCDPQLLREPHAVPLRLGEHWGDVVLQHGRQRLDGELKPTSGWDGEPGIRGGTGVGGSARFRRISHAVPLRLGEHWGDAV
jgi:hypothetical protein